MPYAFRPRVVLSRCEASMRQLRAWIAAAAMLLPVVAVAQTPTPPATAPNPTERTYLKLAIEPSRTPITMDTEAGISAEIKNVSNVPERLTETQTVFTTAPETRLYGAPNATETNAPPGFVTGCATFPTQGSAGDGKRPSNGYDLLLQPGDSYRVFSDLSRNGCTGERLVKLRWWHDLQQWMDDKWQRVMFAPGPYKVTLNVVFVPD